jgi:hypothetical protein
VGSTPCEIIDIFLAFFKKKILKIIFIFMSHHNKKASKKHILRNSFHEPFYLII